MSFTRRGCFKCGNIGHSAADCESTTRLCYNCRAPDHESSSCPHPRTTETKQCYSCAGVGHVSANCPSQQQGPGFGGPQGGFRGPPGGAMGGAKCYNCGGPGHIARLCPSPPGTGAAMGLGAQPGFAHNPSGGNFGGGFRAAPMGGFPGGFPRAPGGFGGPRVNPAAIGSKCYRCNGDGHFARDCPTPAGQAPGAGAAAAKPKTCYKCQQEGHIARECPEVAAAVPAAEVNGEENVKSPAKATTEAGLVPAAAEVHV